MNLSNRLPALSPIITACILALAQVAVARSQEPAGKEKRKPTTAISPELKATCLELLKKAMKPGVDGNQNLLGTVFLSDVAICCARLKHLQIMEGARQYSERLNDTQDFANRWVSVYAHAGNIDEAIRLALRVDTKHGRIYALLRIAEICANDRRDEDAYRIVEQIADEKERQQARSQTDVHIALALAKAGEIPAALAVADKIAEPFARIRALCGMPDLMPYEIISRHGIAMFQARDGDRPAARTTLNKAPALIEQARAYGQAALACALVEVGDLPKATELAKSITNERARTMALAAVARGLGRLGRAGEARELFAGAADSLLEMHVLLNIGIGQARAGDRKTAWASFRESAKRLRSLDERTQGEHAAYLAVGQASEGDFEGAWEIFKTTTPPSSLIFGSILYFQGKRGDLSGALKAARDCDHAQFVDSSTKENKIAFMQTKRTFTARTFQGLARLHGQLRRHRDALTWIETLDDNYVRSHAYLGLVEGLLDR